MEGTPNHELILQLQQGQIEALGEIYDRHNQLVFRTALAITGDSEAASDLLQDVFLRVYRFADKVDPERPLEPWLYRVTANLSCTWVKRQKWTRPIDDLAEWLVGDNKTTPSQAAENAETRGNIEKAISRLPLSQRTVIVMYYVNGLSLQEISEILEVPVGTIKSRLHYGRRGLRNEMGIQSGILPEVRYEYT
jgi:RNA polymerase sigma-70 factor (ECF subfamily)